MPTGYKYELFSNCNLVLLRDRIAGRYFQSLRSKELVILEQVNAPRFGTGAVRFDLLDDCSDVIRFTAI